MAWRRHLQAEGRSKLEAIKGAAATRLRPVLMTTGATVLGHFPLVLVSGAGAEARNSIGIILVHASHFHWRAWAQKRKNERRKEEENVKSFCKCYLHVQDFKKINIRFRKKDNNSIEEILM